MEFTTINKNGSTSIPADIRKALGLDAGDKVMWKRDENGQIIIDKAPKVDIGYLKQMEASFSEWHNPEDDGLI